MYTVQGVRTQYGTHYWTAKRNSKKLYETMAIVVIMLEMKTIFTGKAGSVTHVVVVWEGAAERHQLCPQPPNDGVPRLDRPLQALIELQQLTVHLRHL
jgi:hypothetical protein